jgi:hypothetical protein
MVIIDRALLGAYLGVDPVLQIVAEQLLRALHIDTAIKLAL